MYITYDWVTTKDRGSSTVDDVTDILFKENPILSDLPTPAQDITKWQPDSVPTGDKPSIIYEDPSEPGKNITLDWNPEAGGGAGKWEQKEGTSY